jgi:hypothetical protein
MKENLRNNDDTEPEDLTPPELPDFVSNPAAHLGLKEKLKLLLKRTITLYGGEIIDIRQEKGQTVTYRGGSSWRIQLVGPQLYFRSQGWTIHMQNDSSLIMEKDGNRIYRLLPASGNSRAGTSGPDSHFIENIFTREDWRELKLMYGEKKLMDIYRMAARGEIPVERTPNPFTAPAENKGQSVVWAKPGAQHSSEILLSKMPTEKLPVPSNDVAVQTPLPIPARKIRSLREGIRTGITAAAMVATAALAGLGIYNGAKGGMDDAQPSITASLRRDEMKKEETPKIAYQAKIHQAEAEKPPAKKLRETPYVHPQEVRTRRINNDPLKVADIIEIKNTQTNQAYAASGEDKEKTKTSIMLNPQPDNPVNPLDISEFTKTLHNRYMEKIDAGWGA